jgi:GNAT superfamily N-acetyltransferase
MDIDRSYETTETWQMEPRRGNGRLSITFQTLRLPHPLPVNYPYSREQLHERWQNQVEAFFVMEKERRGQNENPLCGYVNLYLDRVDGIAWLGDLVVDPAYRRQGHGEHLLEIASQWGRTQQWGNGDNVAQGNIQRANRLMVAVQTQNSPAIQFCRKNGLTFRGYHETHFHSGDIALYFGVKLK